MLTARLYGSSVDRAHAHRTKLGKRTTRMRQRSIESLDSRTLLPYTFVYGGHLGPQTVNETGGNDSITVVNNGYGLLEWSTDNGATFSTQWGESLSNLPGPVVINRGGARGSLTAFNFHKVFLSRNR